MKLDLLKKLENKLLPERSAVMLPIWGRAKITWTHIAVYVNAGTFVMTTSVWYKVSGVDIMDRYLGFTMPYYVFLLVILTVIGLFAILFEWRVSMPSTYRAQQDLLYTSSEVFRGDIQKVLKYNQQLESDNDELKSQLEDVLIQLEKLNRKEPSAPPIGEGGIFIE